MKTCKSVKILLAALFLCAAAAFSSMAETTYTEDAFYYTIEDKSITITGYFGTDEVVNIPSVIAGMPVNKITPYAFEGSGVKVVNLPETIESVGKGAFDASVEVNYFMRSNSETTASSEEETTSGLQDGPGSNPPDRPTSPTDESGKESSGEQGTDGDETHSGEEESTAPADPQGDPGERSSEDISSGERENRSEDDSASGNGPASAAAAAGQVAAAAGSAAAGATPAAVGSAESGEQKKEQGLSQQTAVGSAGTGSGASADASDDGGHIEEEINEDGMDAVAEPSEEISAADAETGSVSGAGDAGKTPENVKQTGFPVVAVFVSVLALLLILFLVFFFKKHKKSDE